MKLIACYGLPASGKSTWATDHCVLHPGVFLIVSKDAIREELRQGPGGWLWSHAAEKRDVLPVRDTYIRYALATGYSVISDDTNLQRGHLDALAMIASSAGARFEIQRFTDVSVEECIRRDALRTHPVGEDNIRQMADQYLSKAAA